MTNRRIALVAVLLAVACRTAPDPRITTVIEDLGAIQAAITEGPLRRHMTVLSDDSMEGRESGTAGFEKASRYVEAKLEGLGLEPLGESGYRQRIGTRIGTLIPASVSASIVRDGVETPLAFGTDFTLNADPSREESSVEGDVVFVGYGIDAPEIARTDYEGVDVRGKIVAMVSGAPAGLPPTERAYYSDGATKVRAAAAHGAIGTLTVRRQTDLQRVGWDRIAASSRRKAILHKDPQGGVFVEVPQNRLSASLSSSGVAALLAGSNITLDQLLASLDAKQPARDLNVRIRLRRATAITDGSIHNVVGVLRGNHATLRNEYVVVSAHLDHLGINPNGSGDKINNGFYDNASGVAAILEIARGLSRVREHLQRSVVFVAFDAEEKGGHGSSYFARYPPVPKENVVANINVDMFLALFPLADFVARGQQHSTLRSAVERAARDVGAVLADDPEPEETRLIRSDQYNFIKQGIPALIVKSGFTSADPSVDGAAVTRAWLTRNYHQPADDASQPVHWPSVVRITQFNALIAYYVANDPFRPEWNRDDFFGTRFAPSR